MPPILSFAPCLPIQARSKPRRSILMDRRLRNPKFAESPQYVQSFFVNAIKEMRISFDPETAQT